MSNFCNHVPEAAFEVSNDIDSRHETMKLGRTIHHWFQFIEPEIKEDRVNIDTYHNTSDRLFFLSNLVKSRAPKSSYELSVKIFGKKISKKELIPALFIITLIKTEEKYKPIKPSEIIFLVQSYVNSFLGNNLEMPKDKMLASLKRIPAKLAREHVALWFPEWSGAYWLYNSPNDYSTNLKQLYNFG